MKKTQYSTAEKIDFLNNLLLPICKSAGHLQVMTGCRFTTIDIDKNMCAFKLNPRLCSNRAALIEIGVNGKDLYYINFYNVRGRKIDSVEDIFCDQLDETMWRKTALATHF